MAERNARVIRLGGGLRWVWREYTRMRTAIFLLIAVAILVAMGGVIPQSNTSAVALVQNFLNNNYNVNQVFSAIGLPLTDIFVSPFFYTVIGLLYVSLGACVLRRFRAIMVRTVKHYARSPQFWGEWGSWVFHAAFLVLLVAAFFGKATGFQGLVAVTQGQSFTDTPAAYDTLQEGFLFSGRHTGLQFHLNSFNASYQADGEPLRYSANLTVLNHGRQQVRQTVKVNDPLQYDNLKVYLMDYGWSPQVIVRDPAGNIVYNGNIEMVNPVNDGDKSTASGVLKVPDFGYTGPNGNQQIQMGAQLVIIPDAHPIPAINPNGSINPTVTDYGTGGETARNPVIMAKFYLGNLGLAAGAQNVNALDTSGMTPYYSDGHAVPILLGQTVTLPLAGPNNTTEDFSVSFAALPQYAFLQVSEDQGVPFIYLSFVMIMAGLLAKLYLKPWLEARQKARKQAVKDAAQVVVRGRVEADVDAEVRDQEPVGAGPPSG